MIVEEKRNTGEFLNLQKGDTDETFQKKKSEHLSVRNVGDVIDAAGLSLYSLASGKVVEGEMSVAGTEKGNVSGEEMFSSGTAIGKAPDGKVTSPGYAKGKASADGSLTAAAPRLSDHCPPARVCGCGNAFR